MKQFFEAVWFAVVNLVAGVVHGGLSWSANPDNRRAVYFGRRVREGWYGVDPIFTLVFDHRPKDCQPYVGFYIGIGRGRGYMKGWGCRILVRTLSWRHKGGRFYRWAYKWQQIAINRLSGEANFVAGTYRDHWHSMKGKRLHGLSNTRTAKAVEYRSKRKSLLAA